MSALARPIRLDPCFDHDPWGYYPDRGSTCEPWPRRKHQMGNESVRVDDARRRFGGIDIPASVAGTLTALGLTVLLAGLAGAAGSVRYDQGTSHEDLSAAGLAAGMVI